MAAKNKTTAAANSAASYNKALLDMQKSANQTQLALQKMVDTSNKQQQTFNSAEAQKARSWQESMTKSSHQMEVADLKKAGLNPVLSANNGAQSYTTSSATTQNDSGASALASLQASQLSAIGNMESSRMSSEATQRAAKLSADATKEAAKLNAIAQMSSAETSAKAQKYSADQNRAASKYASDRQYAASVYHTDVWFKNADLDRKNQRWIVKNQTANSWAGLVDKYLRNSGMSKGICKVVKDGLMSSSNHLTNPKFADKYFVAKKSGITEKNYQLTVKGKRYVNNYLRGFGAEPTVRNRDLFVKSTVFKDKKAYKQLLNAIPAPRAAGGR